ISLAFGYDVEQFQLREGYTFSAGLLPVWMTLLGAAILEEFAWHGYGTDTLIRRMNVFAASMLFTFIWFLWHIPLAFIDGYYHNEVVESGLLHTLNFPASMIAFVVLMNWLYFRSGRSILIPMIFHVSASFPASTSALVGLMHGLYFRRGGSILTPMVFPISANFSADMFLTHPDSNIIQTVLLLIVSVFVVVKERTLFFTAPAREAAQHAPHEEQ